MTDYFSSLMIFSGFIFGLLFGIIIQKHQICGANATAKVIYLKDTEYFKILYVAISIEIIFFALFSIVDCAPCLSSELSFILNPAGGLLFGFGMIISSGCASGACYKTGEGNNQTLLVLIFFLISGYLMTRFSVIKITIEEIRSKSTLIPQSGVTLPDLTGIPYVIFALIALLVIFLYIERGIWKNRKNLQNESIREILLRLKGNWITVGIILGIIGISAPVFSSLTGRESGISIASGLIEDFGSIFDAILGLQLDYSFGWAGMFVIGTITGAFCSAKKKDQFKITKPRWYPGLRASLGGTMMGIGAVLTGSCNIGHLLNGLPMLSVTSAVSLFFILLGSVIAVKMYDI